MTLIDEQHMVVQTIYSLFRDRGEWPTFAEIDRPLRRRYGIDAAEVFPDLPRALVYPVGPGIGTPAPSAPMRLTLLGISGCTSGDVDVDRIIRLLPWLAQREAAYTPASKDDLPTVTAAEVARFLDIDPANEVGLGRVREILMAGYWGLAGGGWRSGSDWEISLSRDIWRYRSVTCLDDVLDIERGGVAEPPKPLGHSLIGKVVDMLNEGVGGADSADLAATESAVLYVDEKTIRALRAREANGKFDLTKLLALIDELNDNHARGNLYSTLALIRTVLNHVPPIFERTKFEQVASELPWPPTDAKHIKNFSNFRPLGDDALHRPISKVHDVLSPGDIPPPAWLRTLLLACAARL